MDYRARLLDYLRQERDHIANRIELFSSGAAQFRELRFVRERTRGELVYAEEVAELGMLLVEDCARLADGVLPPRERVDVHRMVMPRHGALVVADLQSLCIEAIGELDAMFFLGYSSPAFLPSLSFLEYFHHS